MQALEATINSLSAVDYHPLSKESSNDLNQTDFRIQHLRERLQELTSTKDNSNSIGEREVITPTNEDLMDHSVIDDLLIVPTTYDINPLICNPPTLHNDKTIDLVAATFKKKKWFYVSNLKPGTSESMVKSYICTKTKIDTSEVTVKSLLKKNHDPASITFTSFKVGIDETTDTEALNSIWPDNVTINVFIPKNEYPRRPRQY